MWCSLHEIGRLASEQITRVNTFLTEETAFSTASEHKRYEAGDDGESDVEDAEKPVGVDSWTPPVMDVDSSERSDADGSSVRKAEDSMWLTQTLFGASNTLDVLAYAYTNRIVVFAKPSSNHLKYEVSATINVTENINPEEDYITCIHILPVATTRKSETSAHDWTCVIVALSNGYVNFYTERGVFIFFEQISYGFISNVRFGASTLKGDQELVFLSRDRLVVIDGGSLFSVLRKARAAVARNNGRTVAEIAGELQLIARNLRFHGIRRMFDFALLGPQRINFFEQMVDTCMVDQHQHIVLGTPRVGAYFVLSRNLFGGFVHHDYYAQNFNTIDVVHELAANVTAKMTSYVPSVGFRSFFGFGTSRRDLPNKTVVKDAKQETATIRQLCVDAGRLGDRVFVAHAPWMLMAVADDSARILILDTETRRIIRIFKGYRNARCAFVEARGTVKDHPKPVKALFLVIFAPKRGLLEVWSMQHGPRVSAFNVDPRGRLLSLPMLHDSVLGRPADHDAIYRQNGCSAVFVDSDGHVFKIVAPFRLAARGAHETAMHDENLYKEFTTMSFVDSTAADAVNTAKLTVFIETLKTFTYKRRCIEAILRSRHYSVDSIVATVIHLLSTVEKQVKDATHSNSETLNFLHHLQLLTKITRLYKLLQSLWQNEAIHRFNESLEALKLTETEIAAANLHLLHEAANKQSFVMPSLPTLRLFLDQFDLNVTVGGSEVPVDELPLSPNDAFGKTAALTTIFGPFLFGNVDQRELLEEVFPMLGCTKEVFLTHLIDFWLNPQNTHAGDFADRLVSLFRQFSSTMTRTFLLDIEERVKISPNVVAGFYTLTAHRALHRWEIAERGVATDVEPGVDAFDVDDEWEQMDEYVEYCDLLARHLAVLGLIAALPSAPEVSLKALCDKGPGFYREQIGKWFVTTKLVSLDRFVVIVRDEDVSDFESLPLAERLLVTLLKSLPKTLAADLLLADCAWEAASAWFRDESRRATMFTVATTLLKRLDKTPRLEHGLGFMLWDTFVAIPFRALYRHFASNSGQPPKDAISRRHMLVAEVDLLEFVTAVERLLRAMAYAIVDLDAQPLLEPENDDYVKRLMDFVQLHGSASSSRGNRATLVDIAGKQKPVTHHLIQHHLHLAIATKLRLICSVQIAPAVLFDSHGRSAFFEPLQSHPLVPLARVDERLKASRQKFLEECVTNIVAENADADNFEIWNLILELASEWELNDDALKIKEAVLLYEHGCDNQVTTSVIRNGLDLGLELVPVIIGRVRYFLDEKPALYRDIERRHLAARITLDYIHSFDDAPMPCFEVDPTQTNRLIRTTQALLRQYGSPDDNAVKNKDKILNDCESINVFFADLKQRGTL